jgi:acyl-CoA synthetase (AMP-forming)/AMP-acid ligase II
VQRFQVEQADPAFVTVRLVAPEWSEADSARLQREVAAVAGGSLAVRIEQVDDIPLTAAGKLKVVVNRLAEQGRQQAEAV